jgi:hypothetical protein
MRDYRIKVDNEELEEVLKESFAIFDEQYELLKALRIRVYFNVSTPFVFIMLYSFLAIHTMDYTYTIACLIFAYLFKNCIKTLNSINSYRMVMMDYRNETLTNYIPKHLLIVWDQKEIL